MTRNLCRHADLGLTGHLCTPVIGVQATQGAVFANGIPVLRKYDPAFPHEIRRPGKPPCKPHNSNVNQGSSSVFCLNIPVARVYDSFDKKYMIKGSTNVFSGG